MKTLERLKEDCLLAAEIHKLEARLWRQTRKAEIRVIMVTSAGRGEGKSTTVAYLATALGLHQGRRILAVDLDFREPTLASSFGLEVPQGIGDVLRRECPIGEAILKTDLPGLDVVFPSAGGEDPDLLLRTREFDHLFDYFRQKYDLILLDVPALIPVADASGLLPFVDGVVLVAMAGKTTKTELTRARETCTGMDANILGLVVGNLQEAVPGYAYAGYDYGYGNGKHKENGDGQPEIHG